MKTLLVLSLGCLVLASCSAPAPDIAKVRQEVVAFNDKVEREMVAGIMDTTMSQYTDDAVSMPNNGPMLKGKAAIKEYFSKMMSMGAKFTAVELTTTDVATGGPYVYDIGTYAMTFQVPGMPEFTDHGKYMTIYERVADGSLKIKAETWNTNTEMPMHAPGEPAM